MVKRKQAQPRRFDQKSRTYIKPRPCQFVYRQREQHTVAPIWYSYHYDDFNIITPYKFKDTVRWYLDESDSE